MSRKDRFVQAFTLPELLLSSVIMGFIFTATIISYMMLDRMWKEDLTLGDLARDTNIAVEKMVRGDRPNEGLQAAKAVSTPQSTTVEYTDLNDVSRMFYYSNNGIYTESGKCILSNVKSVAFSASASGLEIDVTTHKYVVDKEINFSLEAKVASRN